MQTPIMVAIPWGDKKEYQPPMQIPVMPATPWGDQLAQPTVGGSDEADDRPFFSIILLIIVHPSDTDPRGKDVSSVSTDSTGTPLSTGSSQCPYELVSSRDSRKLQKKEALKIDGLSNEKIVVSLVRIFTSIAALAS